MPHQPFMPLHYVRIASRWSLAYRVGVEVEPHISQCEGLSVDGCGFGSSS